MGLLKRLFEGLVEVAEQIKVELYHLLHRDSRASIEVPSDKQDYFVDANLLKDAITFALSPSGKYKLEIRTYKTREGCWAYSRGLVTRVSDGTLIADVKRNYHAFPHCFIQKKDSEWLVCGRSYMGQTVINLDTGQEFNDPKWPGGYKGHEFCWSSVKPSPDGNTLAVEGCVWAGPYEIRFYDFIDPSKGWPQLDGQCIDLEADDESPEWINASEVKCFKTYKIFKPLNIKDDDIETALRVPDDINSMYFKTPDSWPGGPKEILDEDYDNEKNWEEINNVRCVLRRDGNKMVEVK